MFENKTKITLKWEKFSSFSVKSPDFWKFFFTICKLLVDTVITNRAEVSDCAAMYQNNNCDTNEIFDTASLN